MVRRWPFLSVLWVLSVAMLLASCAQVNRLAEAPTLYKEGVSYPPQPVPAALRTIRPTIFYMTDRMPMVENGQVVAYSHERSASMAFGSTWVQFGNMQSWDDLVRASNSGKARNAPILTIEGVQETLRFSNTPIPFSVRDGAFETIPEAEAAYRAQAQEFQASFRQELAVATRKDALLYVHGFNNGFEEAMTTVAALWHYGGRAGVPIGFSWPAGNPGLFKYFKDRESGEFAIFHLKETLKMLAAIPELENIKIVAHSRGADVIISALRELLIYERGAGRDPQKSLKLSSLILAAPDLDFGVVQQRLVAERFAPAFDQINIYLNPNDGALGLAQRLATGIRFGRVRPDDLSEGERDLFSRIGNVHFIDVEDAGGRLGHSYFRQNPGVFSDIILTLTSNARPGSKDRPLTNVDANYWSLHRNYPWPRVVRTLPPRDEG